MNNDYIECPKCAEQLKVVPWTDDECFMCGLSYTWDQENFVDSPFIIWNWGFYGRERPEN